MTTEYYINKKLLERNYPDLSFLDKKYITIHNFSDIYINVKIIQSDKLQRKLKLNKLNNNENDKLITFIQFVYENNTPIMDVIEHISKINQNQIKYNAVNYDYVDYIKQNDYNYYHKENNFNSNTTYTKY